MYIVWGSGSDLVPLQHFVHNCVECGSIRPFTLWLRYEYWGIYYVFNRVTRRQYLLLCDSCRHGWEVDSSQVSSFIESDPIPFMRKYGLVMFPLFVGLLVLVVIGLDG